MDDRESMSAQSVQQHLQQTASQFNNTQSNQAVSVLNNFDFTAIDDLDPSLSKLQNSANLFRICRLGTHRDV
jgi:hypothetical protein